MVKVLAILFGLFMVGMLIAAFMSEPYDAPLTPAQQAKKAKQDAAIRRAVAGAKELRDAMRNPDSFRLQQVLLMDDGSVCYDFRSQNGFGGMSGGQAVVTPDGRLRTEGTPELFKGYEAAWKKHCAGKSGDDETDGVRLMAR